MGTLQDMWAELRGSVRRFIGRRVSDPHAADDITQDVLLKLQAQLDAVPADDRLPSWVFAVARNAVIDHYRSRAARRHADVSDVEPPYDAGLDERQAAVRELAPCLSKMAALLPEPYREAMRLADFEGLGQQEVADRMGISLSGAKSRVQRARRQLRDMILDCCHIERDARGGLVDYQTTDRSARYCGDEKPGDGRCAGG